MQRRLLVAAILCATWSDADLVTFAFEVRANEPLGHRGLTHSLFAAAIVSSITAVVAFRALGLGSRAFRRVLAFLFAVSASHGLVDAATPGDTGVALLAPVTNARFSFPFKLVPACPMGLDEYLGHMGLLTLANELLYVVIPLALVVSLMTERARRGRLALAFVVWGVLALGLRLTVPAWFAPRVPRILLASGDMQVIAHDDLPDHRLATRFTELRALGLFDRWLEPSSPAWSSSFFPSWFGGESGRWMDGSKKLIWRTLFGFSTPTEQAARAWLSAAAAGDPAAQDTLFRLAPTEKVDAALGHFSFPATLDGLAITHNAKPKPRYWYGRCSGIAAAAVNVAEPYRVVDVITADGAHVRFHPNDIKSLLSVAYNKPESYVIVGDECRTVAFDAGATCSMNPALLVVALFNRVGIAKQSVVVDALPTIANQYYAVARARVHLVGEPRPLDRIAMTSAMDSKLVGRAAMLVDVVIDLTLSSTTLAYARANVRDGSDPTRYQRVGVVPVPVRYEATLVLDADGDLIGGKWTGDPPDGPDNVVIVSPNPKVNDDGTLPNAAHIPWWFVRELARASVDDSATSPTVDLRN